MNTITACESLSEVRYALCVYFHVSVPMIGLPPHILPPQAQPQMMFAASSQSGQGSAAGEGVLGAMTAPLAGVLAEQSKSQDCAAGGHQIPRVRHHHSHSAAATHKTLSSLAPDVAAAALAAAAGNYNPLMMLQYLAQSGQATPLQLQQLSAVHQAGPVAAVAAWHAAAAASGTGSHGAAPHAQVLFAAGVTAAARLAAAQQQRPAAAAGTLDLSSVGQQSHPPSALLAGTARITPEVPSPPGWNQSSRQPLFDHLPP